MRDYHINVYYSEEDGGYIAPAVIEPVPLEH
jgi:hypothetical protein